MQHKSPVHYCVCALCTCRYRSALSGTSSFQSVRRHQLLLLTLLCRVRRRVWCRRVAGEYSILTGCCLSPTWWPSLSVCSTLCRTQLWLHQAVHVSHTAGPCIYHQNSSSALNVSYGWPTGRRDIQTLDITCGCALDCCVVMNINWTMIANVVVKKRRCLCELRQYMRVRADIVEAQLREWTGSFIVMVYIHWPL